MSATCYKYDGTPYESIKLPCNLTAVANNGHSACCEPNDLCLTNGLCKNPGNDNDGLNYYWQEGCTDPTFKDPACPKYCPGGNPNLLEGNNQFILKCLDAEATWCCAAADFVFSNRVQADCCNVTSLMFAAAEPTVYATARLPTMARSSPSASAPTVSPASEASNGTLDETIPATSTLSTSPPPTISSASLSNNDAASGLPMSTKVILGGSIGAGAALLLTALGVWWQRRRRKAGARMWGRGHVRQKTAELDGSIIQQEWLKSPVELMAPVEMGMGKSSVYAMRL